MLKDRRTHFIISALRCNWCIQHENTVTPATWGRSSFCQPRLRSILRRSNERQRRWVVWGNVQWLPSIFDEVTCLRVGFEGLNRDLSWWWHGLSKTGSFGSAPLVNLFYKSMMLGMTFDLRKGVCGTVTGRVQ
jgi:hypothetical protein